MRRLNFCLVDHRLKPVDGCHEEAKHKENQI